MSKIKYRIIESEIEGYYQVQEWRPTTWLWPGCWEAKWRWGPSGNPIYNFSIDDANEILDTLLKKHKSGSMPRAVIREVEIDE